MFNIKTICSLSQAYFGDACILNRVSCIVQILPFFVSRADILGIFLQPKNY